MYLIRMTSFEFGSQPSVLSSLLGYSQEKALGSPNSKPPVAEGSLQVRWRENFYKGTWWNGFKLEEMRFKC